MKQVDLSHYSEPKPHHRKQLLWRAVNCTLFRWLALPCLRTARVALLRLFGATIAPTANVYASCKIWAPWNLTMGAYSCAAPRVRLYNKASIIIGDNVVVSQDSMLCTASHNIATTTHTLIMAPIRVHSSAWIAAGCFVGMGVTIGEGAVVGARGCVFSDVEAWTVVGGNPARFIKRRTITI